MKPEDRFTVLGVDVSLYRQYEDGSFYAYFSVPRHGRKRLTTHKTSLREAREVARKLVSRLLNSTLSKAVTLEWAITASLDSRWPNRTSEDRAPEDARKRLKIYRDFAGNLNLGELTRPEMSAAIQKFIEYRKKEGKKPRTIINDVRVVSRLLSWLMEEQHCVHWDANPASFSFLRLDSPLDPERHIATEEQVARLLQATTGPLRAVVILILSGARPAGAYRCTWESIDFEARTATVIEKRKERRVRLNEWATAELKALRPKKGGPVWGRKARQFFEALETIARRMKLDGILTSYALRRAVVAKLWGAGVPAEQAAKMLGHSVAVAEKHYKALAAVADTSEHLKWG